MTVIKISDKHANKLRLRFDQQINLNPEKKYKLGVIKMLFSGVKGRIKNFSFDVKIPGKDGNYSFKQTINGAFTIDELKEEIQHKLTDSYKSLMKKYEKENRKDLIDHLKGIEYSPAELGTMSAYDSFHILTFKTPLEMKIVNRGNFCSSLGFENCLEKNGNSFHPNIDYSSSINPKFLKPISILEVHSNITTVSYANHHSHPHSHNEHELLYVSFIDKMVFPAVQYLESPKKVLYVPLKEGLREIREIELTLLDQDHNEIKDISNVIVYLQLLEQ